jgi:FHA domain
VGTPSLQRKYLFLILVITSFLLGQLPVRGQEPIDLQIISIDSTNFPRIQVDFLPLQNNRVVPIQSPNEINISEDIEAGSVEINSIDDRPMVFGLVIETSIGGELEQLKAAALAFVRDVYRDGDILYLYYSSNAGFVVDNRADAEARINAITLENRSLSATLSAVLSEVLAYAPNDSLVSRQVVLMGSLIFSTADLETSTTARSFLERNVPIYSVQIHNVGERGGSTPFYQALGEESGGRFYDLQGSSDLAGDLVPMGEEINQNRTRYQLSYVTRNQSTERQRNITLALNTGSGSAVGVFTYEPVFLPVVPTIVNSNTSPTRSILNGEYTPTESVISVQVDFPDAIPREIASLTLEVVEANTLTPLQPPTIINSPTPDENGNYTVTWDLRGYNQSNSTTPVKLTVRVRDALGLEGQGEQFGQIFVGINPTSTPVPTNTIPPTNTVPPTNTPLPTPTPVAIGPGGFTPEEADKLILLNLVLLGVAIVVAVIAIYLLFTRRGREVMVNTGRAASAVVSRTEVYKRATEIFGIPSPDDRRSGGASPKAKPIAYLYPLKGVDNMSPVPISKREFTFGRASELCDYSIKKAFISAEHFRITQRGNGFVLTDVGSSNGTYVDGVFVQNGEVALRAGSTITIVEVEFQFQPEVESRAPTTEASAPRRAQETEVFGASSTPSRTASASDDEPIDDLFNPKKRNPGMGPRNMFGNPDDGDDGSDVDPNWRP